MFEHALIIPNKKASVIEAFDNAHAWCSIVGEVRTEVL
jgi:hypothetical protein